MTLPQPDNLPDPGETPPGQEVAAPPDLSQYVTREAFEEALEQYKSEVIEESRRVAQSQADKSTRRVRERIQQVNTFLDSMKKQGLEITDAQRQALLDQETRAAMLEQDPEPAPAAMPQGGPGQAQPAPSGAPSEQEMTPEQQAVVNQANGMMRQAGVTIEDNDPEISLIVRAQYGTPEEFLGAVSQAIEAKKTRLASSQPPQPPAGGPSGAPSLVSGGGTANPLFDKLVDPDDLWERMNKEGRLK